jgi:hypothetical protein
MLSGWLRSTLFNRTRRLVTPITFKKKLCTFTAAQAAHRISIPSQLFSASSLNSTEKFTGCVTLALHPLG